MAGNESDATTEGTKGPILSSPPPYTQTVNDSPTSLARAQDSPDWWGSRLANEMMGEPEMVREIRLQMERGEGLWNLSLTDFANARVKLR